MIEIRDARVEEHEGIGDLIVRAYRPVFDDLGGYEEELRDVAAHAASAHVLVAVSDGQLVGSATYVPGPGPLAEWSDPDAAGIRFLAVAPEWQGRGAGRALVEACLDLARRDGRPRLLLHTTDRQAAAQRLYRGLGFARSVDLDEEVEPGFWLRGYRFELA